MGRKKHILFVVFISVLLTAILYVKSFAFDNDWQDFDRRSQRWQDQEDRRLLEQQRRYERDRDRRNRSHSNGDSSYYYYEEESTQTSPGNYSGDIGAGLALGGIKGWLEGEQERRRRERSREEHNKRMKDLDAKIRELDQKIWELKQQGE